MSLKDIVKSVVDWWIYPEASVDDWLRYPNTEIVYGTVVGLRPKYDRHTGQLMLCTLLTDEKEEMYTAWKTHTNGHIVERSVCDIAIGDYVRMRIDKFDCSQWGDRYGVLTYTQSDKGERIWWRSLTDDWQILKRNFNNHGNSQSSLKKSKHHNGS